MSQAMHARAFDPSQAQAADNKAEANARELVNPASGLANDYLNIFNEIVMLIEQLPDMRELEGDLLAWRPISYRDYFSKSVLPGSQSAIEAYEALDNRFRRKFEEVVQELDSQATGIVASIRRQLRNPATNEFDLRANCERGGSALRETLDKAVGIVNHGLEGIERRARAREDRLLKVRIKAIKDVEEFYSKPLWPTEEEQG